MLNLQLFTDGSVNTQLKVGYGAYLVVPDLSAPLDMLKGKIKTKRFASTSSTKLELQTLLWALDEIVTVANQSDVNVTVFTDCQNIINLPSRRAGLEQRNYLTSQNKPLKNHQLYREFYRLTSSITCTFVKVRGHQLTSQKDELDKRFALVDKASRRALREEF